MRIDFNAYTGDYPGRVHITQTHLQRMLAENGIDCAVVTQINAAPESPMGNLQEAKGIIPFACIRPETPLDAIPTAVRGIRLHPGSDTWNLEAERTEALFARAQEHNWVVQLSMQYLDPRAVAPAHQVAEILDAFQPIPARWPKVRFVLTGARYFDAQARPHLFETGSVWMDISHVRHPLGSMQKLVKTVDPHRLLFGTNTPFFYPQVAVFRLEHSGITEEEKRLIQQTNAQELLGI